LVCPIKIECPAFFIAVDYQYKRVIISIRGTSSVKDAMTDIQHTPVPIPNMNLKQEWYGHQGMTHSALNIEEKIETKALLKRAFNLNTVNRMIII
jgi:sn1-specific diacylglycerol lipase